MRGYCKPVSPSQSDHLPTSVGSEERVRFSLSPLPLTQRPQSLVAIINDSPLTRSGAIVPFVVAGGKFAGAIAEPIPVHPANNFALTVANVIVAHGLPQFAGEHFQVVADFGHVLGFDVEPVGIGVILNPVHTLNPSRRQRHAPVSRPAGPLQAICSFVGA